MISVATILIFFERTPRAAGYAVALSVKVETSAKDAVSCSASEPLGPVAEVRKRDVEACSGG